jgi:hypothetical protein
VLTKRLWNLFTIALLLWLLVTPTVLAADESDGMSPGLVIGLSACGFLCVLVIFALDIYMLYFLYTDAEARGASGVMWLLIGLVASWIGLVIWLIVRPEKKP